MSTLKAADFTGAQNKDGNYTVANPNKGGYIAAGTVHTLTRQKTLTYSAKGSADASNNSTTTETSMDKLSTVNLGVGKKVTIPAGYHTKQIVVNNSVPNKQNITNDIVKSGTITAGYYSGNAVTKKAGQTYDVSTSDRTINANQFLTGDQVIRGVATSNISADNIKYGATVKVGDTGDAGRIKNISGSFTGDATAGEMDILKGKIGYVKGAKVTGKLPTISKVTADVSNNKKDGSLSTGSVKITSTMALGSGQKLTIPAGYLTTSFTLRNGIGTKGDIYIESYQPVMNQPMDIDAARLEGDYHEVGLYEKKAATTIYTFEEDCFAIIVARTNYCNEKDGHTTAYDYKCSMKLLGPSGTEMKSLIPAGDYHGHIRFLDNEYQGRVKAGSTIVATSNMTHTEYTRHYVKAEFVVITPEE